MIYTVVNHDWSVRVSVVGMIVTSVHAVRSSESVCEPIDRFASSICTESMVS